MTGTPLTIEAKGLLFDNDGVLISSIESVIRCWRQWAAMYDVPNAETYDVPHGVRAMDVIKQLRPDIDAAEGLKVIEDLEIDDVHDVKVLAGVRDLLKSLPEDRWTIVTSGTRRLFEARLKAAELPIPAKLVTADDVVNGKPDPEPYRKGAALLGFANSECIVIEDAPSGVGAGIAAGSRALAVLGTHSVDDLHAATWVVRSLEDVKVTTKDGNLYLHFTPLRG